MSIAGVDASAVVEEPRQNTPIVRTLCRQVKRGYATVVPGVDIGSRIDEDRHTPWMPGCGMQSGSTIFVAGPDIGAAIHESPELYRPIGRCCADEGRLATIVPSINVGAPVNEQSEHGIGVSMPLRAKQRGPPSVVPGVNVGAPVEEQSSDIGTKVMARHMMQRGSPPVVAGIGVGAPVEE